MNCSNCKELIPEHVAGDLADALQQEMEAHLATCAACRSAVADWCEMQSLLRASWPAEDARKTFLLPEIRPRGSWLEATRNWFALGSMATVSACVLLLLLLRPSVRLDHAQLSVDFAPARSQSAALSAQPLTEEQIRSLVQQAVASAQSMKAALPATVSMQNPVSLEETNRFNQLSVQIQLLKENQLSLWREVQQHGLYLQSSWHPSSDEIDLQPKPPSLRP